MSHIALDTLAQAIQRVSILSLRERPERIAVSCYAHPFRQM